MEVNRTGNVIDDITFPSLVILTGTGAPALTLSNAAPLMTFVETDESANEKIWSTFVGGGVWQFGPATDAGVVDVIMSVDRTLGIAGAVTFATQVIISNTNGTDLLISDPAPLMEWFETGVATDTGRWTTFVDAEVWHFGPATDAGLVRDAMKVTRTVDQPDVISFFGKVDVTGTVAVSKYYQSRTATDAQLNQDTDAVNTDAGKIQGAMVYNTSQDRPVWAVGNAGTDVWVDGAGTTRNTPV